MHTPCTHLEKNEAQAQPPHMEPEPYDLENPAYTLNPYQLIIFPTYMQAPQEPSMIDSSAYQLIVHLGINIPSIHQTSPNPQESTQSTPQSLRSVEPRPHSLEIGI